MTETIMTGTQWPKWPQIPDFLQHELAPVSNTERQDWIDENEFAGPYRSRFTMTPLGDEVQSCLSHVNCSYLSTKGHAPSLLQLKQHAQALTVLIKQLTVSTQPGIINNNNSTSEGLESLPSFVENESYDWLNDLNRPYANGKAHHNQPLHALMNLLEPSDAAYGPKVRDVCPLHTLKKPKVNAPSQPYAINQDLLRHANEILELLDHNYSATGGLLSILPPEETEERKLAESTCLGQMIIFMQRMVYRLHDLQRGYANAVDTLAGEAVVPHQTLSELGIHGRAGRELVYPQDRFVLANAGNDVWHYLNHQLNDKDREYEGRRESLLKAGLEGEAGSVSKDGTVSSKDLTYIDVMTRYCRVRGSDHKTVFIIPAHSKHPGTETTRTMESKPIAVNVLKPYCPERASSWEISRRDELESLRGIALEYEALKLRCKNLDDQVKVLEYENASKTGIAYEAGKELVELKKTLSTRPNEVHARLQEQATEIKRQSAALIAAQDDLSKSQMALSERSLQVCKQEVEVQKDRLELQRKMEFQPKEQDVINSIRKKVENDAAKQAKAYMKNVQTQLHGDIGEKLASLFATKRLLENTIKAAGMKYTQKDIDKHMEMGHMEAKKLVEEMLVIFG